MELIESTLVHDIALNGIHWQACVFVKRSDDHFACRLGFSSPNECMVAGQQLYTNIAYRVFMGTSKLLKTVMCYDICDIVEALLASCSAQLFNAFGSEEYQNYPLILVLWSDKAASQTHIKCNMVDPHGRLFTHVSPVANVCTFVGSEELLPLVLPLVVRQLPILLQTPFKIGHLFARIVKIFNLGDHHAQYIVACTKGGGSKFRCVFSASPLPNVSRVAYQAKPNFHLLHRAKVFIANTASLAIIFRMFRINC